VSELDLLFTGGRISQDALAYLQSAFDAKNASSDAGAALRETQVLLTATPEFHATNLARISNQTRSPPPVTTSQSRPYKAIVYVAM